MHPSTTPGDIENLGGKSIKGYDFLERIGTGGFGAVYRAIQSTIGREVAIKIILPGWANNPEFIRRFESEAQVIARLEHPYIVPLHDYWRDPSGACLVMRYLRGGSLRDALREGPYGLEAVSRLLDQVASALDLAHRNNVIHRDVKPGNILLDEDGNAYLGDFGIAKDLTGASDSYITPDGVIGSLDYISPEQARGEPVTPQTDIYGLGVTLFEMITGRHPFGGGSPVDMLYHHINDPLPPIDGFDPALCDALSTILATATAKAPQRRYPDVMALAAAFREGIGRSDAGRELHVIEQLTMREHEVLQLIAQGLTNQQIADRLFVTVATVRWHIRQLYKTLGVRSRVQATIRARELNLIVTGAIEADRVPGTTTAISLPEPENPYKGLRSFQVADAPDFFGREAFVTRLLERMNDGHRFSRFLAIVGPSGSGKSSVVRAGLIPALWQGRLPGSERWFVVDMVPGTRPLDQLEVALVRVAANQAENLRQQLARDANGLLRAADLILPRDHTELVLVIDQFEELFTLVDDDAMRVHFLGLLQAAVTDLRSRIRVVATLRADYYDRPLHYPEFGELVRSRMETVLPLSAQGLEQAISGPARRVGMTLQPGLVAQIVSEMHYQAGALPLLQYALTELFERREGRLLTHAAYAAMGGAVGALANRADEIYYSMDEAGRDLTRQIFLRLVTLGEHTGYARRRVPRSELLALDNQRDLMDEIIDTFADYRLLSLDHEQDTRRPTVELAHEAILAGWERLRDWLDDSRHDIRQQRLLAAATHEWLQADKDTSYLLRGARLEQFKRWAEDTSVSLTAKERDYLDASIGQNALEHAVEHERQQREVALARSAAEAAQQAAISQRRAAQRLRYLVGGLLVFLTAALGLSLFSFSQRNRADNARATSDANAARAEHSAIQAQELALVNGAEAALAQGDLETALALAIAANRVAQPSAQAERVLSEAAYRSGPVQHYAGMQGGALKAAFSPDGTTILAGGIDNAAYVWDVASGQLLHRLEGHTNWIVDVGVSPDGRTGFTISRDRTIILWDMHTGQAIRRFGSDLILGPEMLSATFSPDGRTILSNNGGLPASNPGEEANLILWGVATGTPIRTFRGHTGGVGGLAISPDGRRVLSGAFMGEMILWDIETGDILERFGEESGDWRRLPSDIVFSPDGRTAYAKGMDGVVVTWDLETLTARSHLGDAFDSDNWAWSQLALSPDGHWLCTQGAGEGRLAVWDARTGTLSAQLPASAMAVAFSPDGRSVLAGEMPEMRLWEVSGGAELQRFEVAEPVFGIALSPDGSTLFAASSALMGPDPQPCEFAVFDVRTGRRTRAFSLPADETDALGCILWARPVFGRDGRTILAGADERVILWDVLSGERFRTFSGHSASLTALAISRDGHSVLSGDLNGVLILWDMATAQAIRRMIGHDSGVSDIIFGVDGVTALTGSSDGTIILWDLTTGRTLRRFDAVDSGVMSVDLTPDGQTLVSHHENGLIQLWDASSGEAVRGFMSAMGGGEARFTQDGDGILTSNGELWDLSSGEIIRRYQPGDDLLLSPDGASFFVTVWQPSPAIVQARLDTLDHLVMWTLDRRVVRELSCDERALYRIDPFCDEAGVFPTRTPLPTPFSTPSVGTVPAQQRAEPTTALSPTPSMTPRALLVARVGENRGEVAIGDEDVWHYEGLAGEALTIRVIADNPAGSGSEAQPRASALDTLVIVTAPDGRDLNVYNSGGGMVYAPEQSDDVEAGTLTDSLLEGLVLPVGGWYQIIVSGSGYRTGGAYTMIIESQPLAAVMPPS